MEAARVAAGAVAGRRGAAARGAEPLWSLRTGGAAHAARGLHRAAGTGLESGWALDRVFHAGRYMENAGGRWRSGRAHIGPRLPLRAGLEPGRTAARGLV